MTRRATVVILAVVVVLLALGAIPSLLGSGPTYRLTIDPVADGPAYNLTEQGDDDLTRRRFEYFFSALESGESKPYQTDSTGLKESFTHSPFDEMDTFRTFAPEGAIDDDAVFVRLDGTRYRVTVERTDG